ncbi:MAG: hypothetical protein JRH20_05430 [Deltaproteobacteria bacterium]|nr:hypothetical protein [Deltaproteobacteria bacterium]
MSKITGAEKKRLPPPEPPKVDKPDLAEIQQKVGALLRQPGSDLRGNLKSLTKGLSPQDKRALSAHLTKLAKGLPESAKKAGVAVVLRDAIDTLSGRAVTKRPSSAAKRLVQVSGRAAQHSLAQPVSGLSDAEQLQLQKVKTALEGGVSLTKLGSLLAPKAEAVLGQHRDVALAKATKTKNILSVLGKLSNRDAERFFGSNNLRGLKSTLARRFYGEVKNTMITKMTLARNTLAKYQKSGLAKHWKALKSEGARLKFCRDLGIERGTAQKLAKQTSAPISQLSAQVKKATTVIDRAIQRTQALNLHDPKDCMMLSKVGSEVKCDLTMGAKTRNNSVLDEALKQVAAQAHDQNTAREGLLSVAEVAIGIFGGIEGSVAGHVVRCLNETVKLDRAQRARDIGKVGRIGLAGISTTEDARSTAKTLKKVEKDGLVAVASSLVGVAGSALISKFGTLKGMKGAKVNKAAQDLQAKAARITRYAPSAVVASAGESAKALKPTNTPR